MSRLLILILWLISPWVLAAIKPEVVGKSMLAEPQPTWFFVRDGLGPIYLFDAEDAQMLGLLSISEYTPAVEPFLQRGEIYAAESYYSRGHRGKRTDVVTIYDLNELAPKAEIEIPAKVAALPFRHYITLLDDERHLAVFNMTPAQSVSLVDIVDQKFVTEISTPGCALTMQGPLRSFMQLCGDGTLQLVRIDKQGRESERTRSRSFFDIKVDPVFDKPLATPRGWVLTSYLGKVFQVTVDGSDMEISKPWSMLTEDEFDEGWRPGGGQFIAYHADLDLMFVLMNSGGEFAHDSAGSQVWVFDRAAQRRVGRLDVAYGGTDLFVTPTAAPLLVISGEDSRVHIYDVATLTEQRTIDEVGRWPGYLQGF
jgi:methylamine dehydrogenase heavy chain